MPEALAFTKPYDPGTKALRRKLLIRIGKTSQLQALCSGDRKRYSVIFLSKSNFFGDRNDIRK